MQSDAEQPLDVFENFQANLLHNSFWWPRSAPGAEHKQFTPPCKVIDVVIFLYADFG
jgi:hypothetical protein